jgi:hypothetical protein
MSTFLDQGQNQESGDKPNRIGIGGCQDKFELVGL